VQRIKHVFSVVLCAILCASFLVGLNFDFVVSPSEITFEVRSNKPSPKYHEIYIDCADGDGWSVEYPFGFGGETEGTGSATLRVYPLGNLARADDVSMLEIKVGEITRTVTINVVREKIQKFTMRIFPGKRTFYPGGSGKFTILLTCPDSEACGTVTFTKPKDPVSGRVGVAPTYIDLPGIATTGMGSTTYTEPKLFSLEIEASTKNYKQTATMTSDVVGEETLPENPEADISTDSIKFTKGVSGQTEYIDVIPTADENLFVWEALPTVPWIDIEPKQGRGKGRIKVTVFQEGLTDDAQDGVIELTFPGKISVEKVVAVKLVPNPADNFEVTPENIFISTPDIAPPTQLFVDVLEGVKWSVVDSSSWIVSSVTSGVGPGEVTLRVQSDEQKNAILKGHLTVALTDYNTQKTITVSGYVAPEGYLPKEIVLSKSDDLFTGKFVVGSMNRGELLLPVQSKPSFHMWLDVENWPEVTLRVKRLWGDEQPPDKVVFWRYIPGVIGFVPFEVDLRILD